MYGYYISAFPVDALDIVEKELDRRDWTETSNRLASLPLKRDERFSDNDGRFERDYEFAVTGSVNDNRFHGQRENFANLYISGPSQDDDDHDNGDVIYGARERQPINSGVSNVREYNRFPGEQCCVCRV